MGWKPKITQSDPTVIQYRGHQTRPKQFGFRKNYRNFFSALKRSFSPVRHFFKHLTLQKSNQCDMHLLPAPLRENTGKGR